MGFFQERIMEENTGSAPGGRLEEHSGAVCRRCDKVYTLGMSKCPACGQALRQLKWYTRLLVERIAFIPASMIVIFALSFLSSDSELKALPIIVPAAYVLGHTFMGVRFREKFFEGQVPYYARSTFSFKRFLREGIVFAVVVLILGVGFAVVEILRYLNPE